MKKKRLIIGLFTAGLIAAAVPVASAATTSGSAARGPCHTWQFDMPAGTWYNGNAGLRKSTGNTKINVHRFNGGSNVSGNIYHYTNRGGNLGWHRIATNAQTNVYKQNYTRCW